MVKAGGRSHKPSGLSKSFEFSIGIPSGTLSFPATTWSFSPFRVRSSELLYRLTTHQEIEITGFSRSLDLYNVAGKRIY